MRLNADTLRYISWIVSAKSQQEARDLVCAAIQHKKWRDDHAVEAIQKSFRKSDWERAVLVVSTCLSENYQLPSEVYSQMINALCRSSRHDVAWEVVFRTVCTKNLKLSAESLSQLQNMVKKDHIRSQTLQSYMDRNNLSKGEERSVSESPARK